ncbi:thiolase family protein [Nocardia fusca]|uniref:thiolase family protein n=1 Tax=Nocardia fusca TaxID=941183 RepID=UPI0037878836
MIERFEDRVVISGAGQSEVSRRGGRSALALTLDAALEAIAEAGLTTDDIDGISTWPGEEYMDPGLAGPGIPTMIESLRLRVNYSSGGPEGFGQMTAFVNAAMAVATGLSNHVLVYRTVTEGSAQGTGGRKPIGSEGRVTGQARWSLPFGGLSAANWLAMFAQRHMATYGTTREHLAAVAVTEREHAALNPKAVYRKPLTTDEYLASRMITTPFCLYDCDVPCDGSTAFVLSRREHEGDGAVPAVRIAALGSAVSDRPSMVRWQDMTQMAAFDAAAHMWSRTDLEPGDLDAALLYDGFSVLPLFWLEALGICQAGESGPFVASGAIKLGGSLPMNTQGGQLSGGRLHGFGMLHEAVLQARGGAGKRQVAGAETAVATIGGGSLAGCAVLTAAR